MKNTIAAAMIAIAASSAAACGDRSVALHASGTADASRVERGRYLVSVVGCGDCHTPLKMGPKGPEPDRTRFLSGHPEQMGALPANRPQGPWLWAGAATNTAFAGPWGISYAANLTPDQNTGLGIWTQDMFVKAMRTGRHMGVSRPIMPPMPWPAVASATDEDLIAIYTYLRSITPITNHVPDAQPAAAPAATEARK